MKYLIFGAGSRGKTILHILGEDKILAFIDSNEQKIGRNYCGKKVISFQEYKDKYNDYVLILSPVMGDDLKEMLDAEGIFYLALDECPSEFMGYGWKRVENSLPEFEKLCLKGEKIIIYGCTLYSIWLYERLTKILSNDIILAPDMEQSEKKIQDFKSYFCEYPIHDWNEIKGDNNRVLITTYDKKIAQEIQLGRYNDVFDWSLFYSEYDNYKIKEFHNRHKGDCCFIVATGPSLQISDLEKLKEKQIISFSMNSIFEIYNKTDWRPDYYAIVDAIGIDMWKDKLSNVECGNGFISDASIEYDYGKLPSNMHVFHALSGAHIYNEMNFSEECSKYIYSIGTITYVCLQLAIYMGFKEIFLLGVDFNYKPQKGNYISNSQEIAMSQNYISISDYYVQRAYEKALYVANQKGVKIFNATRGGKLEVFERVDVDSILL